MISKSYLRALLIISFLLEAFNPYAQPYGYSYAKEIIIQESQIPGTTGLVNFPVLFNVVDADLRSTTNGGHIGNANGYDILFYESGCVTKLDHQVERYNPATGELVVWIRIPYLSATANTSIVIYYGNDTVSINPSTNTVWNSNYNGVWHLNENPAAAAPQITDYTGNGHNGTSFGGMTAANSVSGKMANGVSFDEVNDHIRIPDFLYGQELTMSFWFNASEVNGTGYQYMFSHGVFSTQSNLNVYIGEDAISPPAEIPNRQMIKTNYRDTNDANNFDTLDAGNTWIDGNWHYYTMKIQDEGGATIYIDGSPVVNYNVWGENLFDPINSIYLGGRQDLQATRFFGGFLDEVRISSAWHTHEWIATEFNNQNNPSSFYTVGPEGPAVSYCSVLDGHTLLLSTTTGKLENKLQCLVGNTDEGTICTIERSFDLQQWKALLIKTFDKANQGISILEHTDDTYADRVYYRAHIQKSGGRRYYSRVESIDGRPVEDILVNPNPVTNGLLRIQIPGNNKNLSITLYSLSGKIILNQKLSFQKELRLRLPSSVTKGIYLLQVDTENKTSIQKLIVQ